MHPHYCYTIFFSLLVSSGQLWCFNVSIVSYLAQNRNFLSGLSYCAPGFELAAEELSSEYGFNVKSEIVTRPYLAICDDLIANVELVARYVFTKNTSSDALAFFPNGCEEGIDIGRLGREWNLAVFPVAVSYTAQKQVQFYPTLVSFAPVNITALFQAHMDLFQYFSWTNIIVIYDSFVRNVFSSQVGEYMRQAALLYPGVKMYYYTIDSSKKYSFDDIIRQIKFQARVVVLGVHATIVRKFVVTAYRNNMTNEYVYLTTIPFDNKPRYGILKARTGLNNTDDEYAVKAYRSLFQITTSCTGKLQQLALLPVLRQIKLRGIRNYNAVYEADADDDQPSAIALAGYFGVKAYGQILYETIKDGQNPLDASSMRRRFLNRTFTFLGQHIHIDETGTRVTDICVKDYSSELDSFEPAIFYDPNLSGSAHALNFAKTVDWGTPNNLPPANEPVCGYAGDKGRCQGRTANITVVLATIIPVFCTLLLAVAVGMWQIRKFSENSEKTWWKIDPGELQLISENLETNENQSVTAVPKIPTKLRMTVKNSHNIRSYKGSSVYLKRIRLLAGTQYPSAAETIVLKKMKDLPYDNLVRLIGIVVMGKEVVLVHEYLPKGDVSQLLKSVHLDWTFRKSMITDFFKGLKVIHSSPVFRHHGYISLSSCLITSVFMLKLADFELHKIIHHPDLCVPEQPEEVADTHFIAPELTALFSLHKQSLWVLGRHADSSSDIYSTGCFIEYLLDDLHQEGSIDEKLGIALRSLAQHCKRSTPSDRPSITDVRNTFQKLTGYKDDKVVDHLITRMEVYADKLEVTVQERTSALQREKEICHQLLLQMLPRAIVQQLILGHQVQPQIFHGVTIFFSSLVGFIELLAVKSAFFVVQLLNTIFSNFDECLSEFDAYKVETIGDNYMIVSGLPEPNGVKHATEVCSYAVSLMSTFHTYLNGQNVTMKIGIHSGPCAAGIVGSKRPRYCLFGDTVNLASRLATHGLPSKIHVSVDTKSIAELSGGKAKLPFILRGDTELKGAGRKLTYWLLYNGIEESSGNY